MSIEALNWAFAQVLEPQVKFTLVALANRADEEGICFPSVRWIKQKTCFGESTIRGHLRELITRNLLTKEIRFRDDGGQSSNTYRLALVQPGLKLAGDPAADSGGGGSKSAPTPAAGGKGPRQKAEGRAAKSGPHETKEETKDKTTKPVGGEATASPPFITIPLVNKDSEYTVTEADVAEWQEAFPGIDVRQWLRTIRQWNVDNPTRRKTASGIRKHISGWLAKEQNRAPRDARPAKPHVRELLCAERVSATETCGMPGKNYGGTVRCEGHQHKHLERSRGEMPAAVRAQLGLKPLSSQPTKGT